MVMVIHIPMNISRNEYYEWHTKSLSVAQELDAVGYGCAYSFLPQMVSGMLI